MTIGPAPLDHQAHVQIAQSIADQLTRHFGEKLIAIGLYGSIAQGTDAPCSDIEMYCVLDEPGLDTTLEWSAGDWKAEVDLLGVNTILKQAARVESTWSIVKAAYVFVQPLYDPTNLFIHVRRTAITQQAPLFQKAMRQLIVDEIYELAGKIRNMDHRQDYSMLAYYAANLARWGACLIGLDNRFVYPSGGVALKASLTLDNQPQGYDSLCQLVMSGRLSDEKATSQACENFWQGINQWAAEKGMKLVDDLGVLLDFLRIP